MRPGRWPNYTALSLSGVLQKFPGRQSNKACSKYWSKLAWTNEEEEEEEQEEESKLVSPSRSLPGDSLSRNSEGGSQDMFTCTPFPCIPDAQGVLLVMTKIEGLPSNVL